MAAYEGETGDRLLAIPHNGNLSNGLMFDAVTLTDRRPLDRDYAERRMRWEPIYEVTQIKGDGETHPSLSPNDHVEVEVARLARREHQPAAVGRPGRVARVAPGVGELDWIRPVGVADPDLKAAAARIVKGQPRPVGRVGGTQVVLRRGHELLRDLSAGDRRAPRGPPDVPVPRTVLRVDEAVSSHGRPSNVSASDRRQLWRAAVQAHAIETSSLEDDLATVRRPGEATHTHVPCPGRQPPGVPTVRRLGPDVGHVGIPGIRAHEREPCPVGRQRGLVVGKSLVRRGQRPLLESLEIEAHNPRGSLFDVRVLQGDPVPVGGPGERPHAIEADSSRLLSPEGRHGVERGPAPGLADEGNVLPVGRPSGVRVGRRVLRQAKGPAARGQGLDVDVIVVRRAPDVRHLLAVRGETGARLVPAVAGEGCDLQRRRRGFGRTL